MSPMRALLTLLICLGGLIASPALASKNKKSIEKKNKVQTEDSKELDLNSASFKEILDRYVFIADFNQKPSERPVSQEFFWKYPFKMPPINFEIDGDRYDLNSLVFQVKGAGRRTALFNDGRAAFLERDYQKAHAIWLAAREEFKDDVKVNRLFEFFLGINALAAYKKKIADVKTPADPAELDGILKRVAYFFASTFILRRDVPDARIDPYAAWALYNIAAIYNKFDRMPSAYGASQEGLASLLKEGNKLHRSEFRQIAAEAQMRNHDLMSAVQELDTALRQDPDPKQAKRIFNRAGDIYFTLNNYELAEDMYAMANSIERDLKGYDASQAILRGETAFWLGRFDDAEKTFKFAVDSAMRVSGNEWLQDSQTIPWALLRVADSLLARAATATGKKKTELLEKARLAYFSVQTNYPKSESARIAEVRGACMEMPGYEGKNVKHARLLLEDVKQKNDVPENLMELVWACYAGSYSEREKTDEMVTKIQEFSDKYPRSKFLQAMIPPVRDVQASKIDEYFKKKQWENATDFFQQKRATLFPKISDELAANLWTAFVSTSRSQEALEFWNKNQKPLSSDTDALRRAAFLYEASPSKNKSPIASARKALEKELSARQWGSKPSKEDVDYLARVLASRDVVTAYPWILKVQDIWTKSDKDAPCTVLFPLLSRIDSDKRASSQLRADVKRRTREFGDTNLAGMKDKDPSCFQSWIDLEAKVLSPSDLGPIYQKRQDWPLDGAWLERSWTYAEELNARGKRAEASKIWKEIAEKAPKDSFEARMAKTRLDPTRTEYESLWR